MANPLAARLLSDRTAVNDARPGGTVTVEFTSRRITAGAVSVEVLQAKDESASGGDVRVIATFRGNLNQGVLERVTGTGHFISTAPAPSHLTPIRITAGNTTVDTNLNDFETHQLFHLLRVRVRATIAGTQRTFAGRASLRVNYPQVMLAPAPGARLEPAHNVMSAWATNWAAHDPTLRTVYFIPTTRSPTVPLARHYDALLRVMRRAVTDNPGGILALSVGHSDGGDGETNAWTYLVPEDERGTRQPDGSIIYERTTLFIHQQDLVLGQEKGTTPTLTSRVRLSALDRLADILKELLAASQIPMRKMILHSCRAGTNRDFLRLFADRAKIPVQAHTESIVYEGRASGPVFSYYQPNENSAREEVERHEWPTELLSELQSPAVDLDGSKSDDNGNFPPRHELPPERL